MSHIRELISLTSEIINFKSGRFKSIREYARKYPHICTLNGSTLTIRLRKSLLCILQEGEIFVSYLRSDFEEPIKFICISERRWDDYYRGRYIYSVDLNIIHKVIRSEPTNYRITINEMMETFSSNISDIFAYLFWIDGIVKWDKALGILEFWLDETDSSKKLVFKYIANNITNIELHNEGIIYHGKTITEAIKQEVNRILIPRTMKSARSG